MNEIVVNLKSKKISVELDNFLNIIALNDVPSYQLGEVLDYYSEINAENKRDLLGAIARQVYNTAYANNFYNKNILYLGKANGLNYFAMYSQENVAIYMIENDKFMQYLISTSDFTDIYNKTPYTREEIDELLKRIGQGSTLDLGSFTGEWEEALLNFYRTYQTVNSNEIYFYFGRINEIPVIATVKDGNLIVRKSDFEEEYVIDSELQITKNKVAKINEDGYISVAVLDENGEEVSWSHIHKEGYIDTGISNGGRFIIDSGSGEIIYESPEKGDYYLVSEGIRGRDPDGNVYEILWKDVAKKTVIDLGKFNSNDQIQSLKNMYTAYLDLAWPNRDEYVDLGNAIFVAEVRYKKVLAVGNIDTRMTVYFDRANSIYTLMLDENQEIIVEDNSVYNKSEIDSMIGDINSILDAINGEVI